MSAHIATWVTAVPNTATSITSGNDFALKVVEVERPGISTNYAGVFGIAYRTADGATRTHSVAAIRATETMRQTALQLLSTGAYPTLMFRVVPDAGVQPGDPPYYVADMGTAFASLGLSELPSGDEGLVP